MYLYRAVDSQGKTLEFQLSPSRDAQAAKRFCAKAVGAIHTGTPASSPSTETRRIRASFRELKAAGTLAASCELWQSKYLNNLIEQDHRAHQTTGQTRHGLLF
jgi:IS6 family transposase